MKTVTIEAPATIANIVCGFDVLGLALKDPKDIMTISFRDEPGLTIEHHDGYQLPTEPEKNVAGAALLSMMEEVEETLGFHL
ncbi:MAG: homoserine kinase, partial [Flavitalea sp.]